MSLSPGTRIGPHEVTAQVRDGRLFLLAEAEGIGTVEQRDVVTNWLSLVR